ncbi:hypothetical protein [Parvibaculum sp.]|uniref:hypothetical protein n=1 Tax=Parvibaculum sp. TaxID=2024848 RepID=UPI00391A051C
MARYKITKMTLWRWENDPELGFPEAVRIRRRRYWMLADLQAFDVRQKMIADLHASAARQKREQAPQSVDAAPAGAEVG